MRLAVTKRARGLEALGEWTCDEENSVTVTADDGARLYQQNREPAELKAEPRTSTTRGPSPSPDQQRAPPPAADRGRRQ